MRIHNINGRKTVTLSHIETVRLRSIGVASAKVQILKNDNASEEDIKAAELLLEDTKTHFDQMVKNQDRKIKR